MTGFAARALAPFPPAQPLCAGRGERFYYRTLPREEFDDTLAQVERWGLDQYLKDRSYETLSYSR